MQIDVTSDTPEIESMSGRIFGPLLTQIIPMLLLGGSKKSTILDVVVTMLINIVVDITFKSYGLKQT